MANRFDISVIIPVYNCQHFLSDAIASSIMQVSPRTEVIVVDDGSTDESIRIARQFGTRIRLIEQDNHGACAARNVGIEAALGKFIKFLDADDYLIPGALQKQLSHAESLKKHEFSYGRMFRQEESTGRIFPHSQRDAKDIVFDQDEELFRSPPVLPSLLYRKNLIESLQGFDVKVQVRQDLDLFARAIYGGFVPVACNCPIYVYRDHENANRLTKRRSANHYANQYEMFKKHIALLTEGRCRMDLNAISNGLGKTIWTTARNALRAGHEYEALQMFDLALKHFGSRSINGRAAYRSLTRFFGPTKAESIAIKIKRTL